MTKQSIGYLDITCWISLQQTYKCTVQDTQDYASLIFRTYNKHFDTLGNNIVIIIISPLLQYVRGAFYDDALYKLTFT